MMGDMASYGDVALILEGGGMRAAYTAPVVVKLIEEGIDVGWVGGISAGATLTANYLSRDTWRTRTAFTDFASSDKFGGWGSFARGQGYFNAEYIYERSSDQDLPYDLEAYTNHPSQAHIEAVRADTGQTVAWGREDMTTQADINVRVRASSTLPLVMNMPYIDDVPYVDGALGTSGGLLIDAAEAAGYKKFLVVMSRPRNYVKEEVSRPNVIKQLFRKWPAVAQAQLDRPAIYNAAKERILELERKGSAMVFFPDEMPVSVGQMDVKKLRSAYAQGSQQFEREWPQWHEFLN